MSQHVLPYRRNHPTRASRREATVELFERIHGQLDAEARNAAEFGPIPLLAEWSGEPGGDEVVEEPRDMLGLGMVALMIVATISGLLILSLLR